MIGKPCLFFCNVNFFQLKNNFLFKPVFIDLIFPEVFLEVFAKFLSKRINPLLFIGSNLIQKLFYSANMQKNIFLQGFTSLYPEGNGWFNAWDSASKRTVFSSSEISVCGFSPLPETHGCAKRISLAGIPNS
jgi:hypothetical protein